VHAKLRLKQTSPKRVGLFGRYIMLFFRDTGLSWRHTGLFCKDEGRFCKDTGFFCRDTELFCRDTGLFCRDIGLFCRHRTKGQGSLANIQGSFVYCGYVKGPSISAKASLLQRYRAHVSFEEMQGSFAEIQGSFAGYIKGFFISIKGGIEHREIRGMGWLRS